jgi:hypothetical protein
VVFTISQISLKKEKQENADSILFGGWGRKCFSSGD